MGQVEEYGLEKGPVVSAVTLIMCVHELGAEILMF